MESSAPDFFQIFKNFDTSNTIRDIQNKIRSAQVKVKIKVKMQNQSLFARNI